MSKQVLIQKAVDYLSTQPSGMRLTMNDVMAAACPVEADDFALDYTLLDEIIDAAESKGIDLDYSSTDELGREPFAEVFVIRKKRA